MNFEIRPQDFQKSWATAYQCAVTNTMELQMQIGFQLKISRVILQDLERFKKSNEESLQELSSKMNQSLTSSADQCVKRVTSACLHFERTVQALTEEHKKRLAAANIAISELNSQKRQFHEDVRNFYQASLWGRVKLLFSFKTQLKEPINGN